MHRSTTTASGTPPFCLSLIAAHVFTRVTSCDVPVCDRFTHTRDIHEKRNAPNHAVHWAHCLSVSLARTASESKRPHHHAIHATPGRGFRTFPNGRRGSYACRERHERTMLFVGKGQADARRSSRRRLRLRGFRGAIGRRALALSVAGNLDRGGCCVFPRYPIKRFSPLRLYEFFTFNVRI